MQDLIVRNGWFSRAWLFVAIALLLAFSLGASRAEAASTLVLSKSRIEVSVTWRSQYDGSTGSGIAVPVSDVFGFFAFSDPANPEVFVKVLDFGTGPLLMFYGGLTDFEYHLTFHNRCTGQDVRMNKAAGSFDGDADNSSMLPGCPVGPSILPEDGAGAEAGRDAVALSVDLARQASALSPTLLLSKGRVEVGLTWRSQYDGSTGTSLATPINDGFGFLSFTDPANPEVFVKVLDFGSAGPLLLFYGGLTDFEYEVTYRNLCTNQTVVLKKPAGSKAGGADNKSMFAMCEQGPVSANLAAIQSVEAKCTSLLNQGLSRLDTIHAVAAHMATVSTYTRVGVDDASLTAYGVFPDGRVHFVVNNREFPPPPAPAVPPASRSSARAASAVELPAAGWARLLQSFSDYYAQQPISDIAGWLESPGGYGVRNGAAGLADLTTLRAISGDGFFYFNTHGGHAETTLLVNQSGPGFFSLQSSTLMTPANDLLPEIKADFAAGRLTYFTAPNGNPGNAVDTRYGITGAFVKTYWHFAANSIVFLNACYSGYTENPEGPTDFIDACWGAGAGVYFGWSKVANANTCFNTVRYFVDRLVGANKFMKESPDQRAFPWDVVYPDMMKHGLTHDPVTGADLIAYPRPGGPSAEILDPSIQDLLVDEYSGKLKLRGSFGSTAGKVTVGGGELAGCSWASDTIQCTLPLTGQGSSGDVIVELPSELGRTRKSNVHQLTEWNIPLHYLWSDAFGVPDLKFEGTGKLRFRADVGSYRDKPGVPPYFPTRGMVPTKDSFLPVTGSGSHADSGSCTQTLSGSGTFPSATSLGGAPPLLVLGAAMKVDANTPHTGALGLGFGAAAGALPFRLTFSGTGCSASNPVACAFGLLDGPANFPSPLDDNSPELPLPAISLTFDSQFAIPKKKFTDPRFGGSLIVEWAQDVVPISPPKPDESR